MTYMGYVRVLHVLQEKLRAGKVGWRNQEQVTFSSYLFMLKHVCICTHICLLNTSKKIEALRTRLLMCFKSGLLDL